MDWARSGLLGGRPLLAVMGSLLLPHYYGFFYVCLVVIAFSNPGFHLVQTSGLSQAVYQAYAWGGSIPFFMGLAPGSLVVLQFGHCLPCPLSPCLWQGLG